jgi:tRNA pseudouridine13 synthase
MTTDQQNDPQAAEAASPNAAGIGGRIKDRPEDFLVDELPLEEPCGSGEHLWLLVEKRDATTADISRALARHFKVAPGAVSVAGIKDKRALTRQVFSVHSPGRNLRSFPAFEHPQAGVLWVDQHTSKLRRGQIAGNRFSIRIRGTSPTDAIHAKQVLDRLSARGVPNRFGNQRFGTRGQNHLIGRALWLGQWQEALDLMLGPSPQTPAAQQESCDHYAAGRLEDALRTLPRMLGLERSVLRELVKTGKPAKAWKAVRPRERGFFISALQSAIFNDALDRRIADDTYDRALPGDLLLTTDGRNPQSVPVDAEVDAETIDRVARFERTPSGPLWGTKILRASGAVDALEVEALTASGLTLDDLAAPVDKAAEMTGGTRRPLRVQITNTGVEGGLDEHGNYVRCSFDLPPGAFATEVMAAIMGSAPPTSTEPEA